MTPTAKQLSFPCLEVEQPIGTFYIGVMEASDVIHIAHADIRRIEDDDEGRVVGIQRRVSPDRVKDIRSYVQTLDATFPTSVIMSLEAENAHYNRKTKMMKVDRLEDIATVIDGQHRLRGLEDFAGTFQLNVTLFIDMEMEDKAMVFSTINLAQTKVNKSIVYDLYEYAKHRSPQKTCHNIAKLMNLKDRSPLHRKIMILGTATGEKTQTITQAGFVEPLLDLVTKDAMTDRDTIQRRGVKKLDRAKGTVASRLIFRNMFIDDRDAEIMKVLWNYFDAVNDRWPFAWPEKKRGNMLNRRTGFNALMRFLRDVYVSFGKPDSVPAKAKFAGVLKKCKLGDDDFTPERFKPGSSGESDLVAELRKMCRIPEWNKNLD